MENPKRGKGKHRDAKLAESKQQYAVVRETCRKTPAQQTAKPESEHESADHNRHGLRVDAIDREKNALPDDLIDKRGHAGAKKQATQQNGFCARTFPSRPDQGEG